MDYMKLYGLYVMIDYDCMGFHADFMDYTFRVN
jgi:hypothetical protein